MKPVILFGNLNLWSY